MFSDDQRKAPTVIREMKALTMSVDSSTAAGDAGARPDTPRAIAKDAYLYAFAMLENCQTMYKHAVNPQAPEYVGGFGR